MRLNYPAIFAFVLLVGLVVLYKIAESSVETYAKQITVVYPLMLWAQNWVIYLAAFVLSGFCVVRAWRQTKLKSVKVLMGILILVACWLLIAVGWHFFTTPQQEYRNQTRFKDHVYYLNVSFGYVLGHDCNLTAYIVYQCDSLGVMCQSFTTPYLDSYPLTGCSGQLTTNEETRFFVDTDILYVQIGAEKFRVS